MLQWIREWLFRRRLRAAAKKMAWNEAVDRLFSTGSRLPTLAEIDRLSREILKDLMEEMPAPKAKD